jgi:cation diffusion facilitator CzcD-associated flavoprotein CzcO
MDYKAVIIGAGCSGITAIKNLIQNGVKDIICIEQNDDIGGNWYYNDAAGHSSVCETTHIISSKTLSAYRGFPMPDDYPDYPSHRQLLDYFHSYVDQYNLRDYIRFNTTVKHAEKMPDESWLITLHDGTEIKTEYLLLSNGHHSVPRIPEFKKAFTGRFIHSHDYKDNKAFADERVLVVGGGNSACDCAVESSRVAKSVSISMRRAHYIIPKFIMGIPTDVFNQRSLWLPDWFKNIALKLVLKLQIGSYKKYNLQVPDFSVTTDHPTLNSELLYKIRHGKVHVQKGIEKIIDKTVFFVDGHQEEYDTIIASTGFKIATPFFNKEFLDYSEAERIELFLRMFHPKHKKLIFIGLIQPQGAIWPISDVQSELAALYIKDQYHLPNKLDELSKEEADAIQNKFLKRKRHTIEVEFHEFIGKLKKEIKKASRSTNS